MDQPQIRLEGDSAGDVYTAFYEHAYEQGWTDGLPIVPPRPEVVARFVEASQRAGDEVIGVLPPRKGRATVEVLAVNAVMAGCRPEYMPVIIAAVEGLLDPAYPLEFMQVTTNPMTPFLLVNGPIRNELEINYGTGCLGPGWRANATIGRAIRLIMINAGGALPGVYSKVSFGSPLRYSYICGENEEENPWTPFHVDRGFAKEGERGHRVQGFQLLQYLRRRGRGSRRDPAPDRHQHAADVWRRRWCAAPPGRQPRALAV